MTRLLKELLPTFEYSHNYPNLIPLAAAAFIGFSIGKSKGAKKNRIAPMPTLPSVDTDAETKKTAKRATMSLKKTGARGLSQVNSSLSDEEEENIGRSKILV
jgi:hypothetical protein